jgi:hypothetical protein
VKRKKSDACTYLMSAISKLVKRSLNLVFLDVSFRLVYMALN